MSNEDNIIGSEEEDEDEYSLIMREDGVLTTIQGEIIHTCK